MATLARLTDVWQPWLDAGAGRLFTFAYYYNYGGNNIVSTLFSLAVPLHGCYLTLLFYELQLFHHICFVVVKYVIIY